MAEGGSVDQVSAYVLAECRIIALGMVGSGKSKTGNNLLGKTKFKSTCSAKGVTEKCRCESASRFGSKIVFIDTPGFFDIGKEVPVIAKEVSKSLLLSSPGPHAFLFINMLGRFTPQEKHTIELCEKVFGEEFYKYLVVVFTHKNNIDKDNITLQQYIDDAPADLHEILRKNGHVYIAIENDSSSDEIEQSMKELFSKIANVVRKNEGHHYTDTMYVHIEQDLLAEENRRRQLRPMEPRMIRDDIRDDIRHERENNVFQVVNNIARTLLPILAEMLLRYLLE